MAVDFTLHTFSLLLRTLLNNGYEMKTVREFMETPPAGNSQTAMLRHDVDRNPANALRTAEIENHLGLKGTYYFRIVKASFDKSVMKRIAALGHEIGYHYEDLALSRGNKTKALKSFEENLDAFSFLGGVKTICMHGSPLSDYDNRMIWQENSYRKYGIICEPYFDIDFSRVLYLTDTGRRWNGHRVSVRDKEMATGKPLQSSNFSFRSTPDIIDSIDDKQLPVHIMFNFHPHRWNNSLIKWSKELVLQNMKNQVKKIIIKRNKDNFLSA